MQHQKHLSLKEIKSIEFDILVEFDKYCRNKGLVYSLAYGTLLGAVRHKGFIPWDDDIDVVMPREEYEQLLLMLREESLAENMQLLDLKDTGYFLPFAKIHNIKTTIKMKYAEAIYGVWIDIFPCDGASHHRFINILDHKTSDIFKKIIVIMNTRHIPDYISVKNYIKKVIKTISNTFGRKKIVQMAEKWAKKRPFAKSKIASNCSWGYGHKEVMESSKLFDVEDIEFEGRLFLATKHWDEYLRRIYGNYLELPPVEKRIQHITCAYLNETTSDNPQSL